jgi:hypothetical protein
MDKIYTDLSVDNNNNVNESVSTDELAAALETPIDFNFQLPDPEDEDIQEHDFQQRLDEVWQICDRFDLQTDIWRGRILRAVRDREKKRGDGRGTGFINWLKDREITKSQAYALIQLANSADLLLAEGQLDPDSINNFSKRAFVETAKAAPEIQQMVSEAAAKGDRPIIMIAIEDIGTIVNKISIGSKLKRSIA